MAKRKAYKALYLAEDLKRRTLEVALAVERQRLAEINEALVPHGLAALEGIPKSSDKITFAPLEFVAARAFMEANQRVTYEGGGYSQNYAWRGIPIYKSALAATEKPA